MAARRRWLQFSLRAFLVALTVACIWIGRKFYLSKQQQQAVKAVEAIGGSVHYDWQPTSDYLSTDNRELKFITWGETRRERSWLARVIGDDFVHDVNSVILRGGKYTARFSTGGRSPEVKYEPVELPSEMDARLQELVPYFQQLPRLRQVLIEVAPPLSPQFSYAAIVKLRRALPLCEVAQVQANYDVTEMEEPMTRGSAPAPSENESPLRPEPK